MLTAWLGAGAGEPVPRIRSLRPSGPGRLLLCTDGLWRYFPDIAALRARTRSRTSLTDARALVAHALDLGGADNVTAVLLPVPGAT